MLERIAIKNLALIRDAELEFSGRLNVLSGETGAGKSIIVDALMLLMGGKYDKTMLSYGADSGSVEGVFSFSSPEKSAFLGEFGIDADDGLVVLRRFSSDGKNDIRINGRSATVKMLKSIMSRFVDICGQNEYQILGNKSEHGMILDAYIGDKAEEKLSALRALISEYNDVRRSAEALGDAEQRLQRIDMLSYQINEIESAAVRKGEEDDLIDLRNRAMHGEKIKSALDVAEDALSGEGCALDRIYEAERALSSVVKLSGSYDAICSRLSDLAVEAEDISRTVHDLLGEVDFDERDLEDAENRLAKLRSLKRKYGDLDALPDKLSKLKDEYDMLSSGDEEYERLKAEETRLLDKCYELCVGLSEIRRNGAKALEKEVKGELAGLGMATAEFEVRFAPLPDREAFEGNFGARGADDVEFMLSPNPGQPLLPLVKIISGGEMSRFMLALKVITGRYGGIDTMIFDEIDTGISGRTGTEVAEKLAGISRYSQVFCVTHLAQIASMADRQYYISKTTDGYTTSTGVKLLDRDGMIDEIVRLSGAGEGSSNARRAAEELKERSDEYKRSLGYAG